jgi:hypothetical protein
VLATLSLVGVGIGGIGDGKGFAAYRPDFIGEVDNFTNFFSISHISTVTVTG